MNSNKSFKEVNFGQGRGYQIHDQAIIAHIQNAIVQKARINLHNGNKFFKPFETSDLLTLKEIPHRITFNLKGKQANAYLYLFKFQFRPFCVYIKEKEQDHLDLAGSTDDNSGFAAEDKQRKEKAYEYIMVKHRFNEQLYQGTLMQGNFLKINQYQNIFLIHDLLIWKDRAHLDNLSDKIKILNDIFKTQFSSDPGLDTHQLLLKEYGSYDQINDFVNNYRNTLPYRDLINGIVFRPEIRNQRLIYLILNRPGQVAGLEHIELETNGSENSTKKTDKVLPQFVPIVSTSTPEHKEKNSKPTIDYQKYPKIVFLMKKTAKQDVYELYLSDLVPKYGIASVTSLQHSEEIRNWYANSKAKSKEQSKDANSGVENQNQKVNDETIVVEAEYVINFNKWKPTKHLLQDTKVSSFNDVRLR